MVKHIKPVVISAPWGNYLHFANTTPTLGTYTWQARGRDTEPRGGRWIRVLLTVRYSWALGGWKNKLGLKNPGLPSLAAQVERGMSLSDKILSVYGFSDDEWAKLFELVKHLRPMAVEVNASCPNITKPPFTHAVFEAAMATGVPVIVKIPPVFYEKIVTQAYEAGVRAFHACNTLPTPVGGVSGKPLIKISQGVVTRVREQYPDVSIIGGGGITSVADAIDYVSCGATHVALGSMLFNIFNWFKISRIVEAVGRGTDLVAALANPVGNISVSSTISSTESIVSSASVASHSSK